jgi:hypothetical protein
MKKSFLKNIIKESITDYLSELNSINEDPSVPEDSTGMALDMMKNGLPTQTTSGKPLREEPSTIFEDKVTKDNHIYLVKKALNESTEKDLVEKKLLLDLIGEGLYEGAYLNEATAMSAAKKALKGRDMQIKENIKKGNSKISELEDQIENLKIDIKAKQSKAIDEPGMRDSLVADVDDLMSKLDKKEAMLNKLKSALEKSSPKKEKKETKDDE